MALGGLGGDERGVEVEEGARVELGGAIVEDDVNEGDIHYSICSD